eukprot:scaffold272271_cov27-Tisochrysis_lutea.AAC.1
MSSHEASRMPAAYSPSQGGGVQEYQWQLTDVSDASGKQYLLDPATKVCVVHFKYTVRACVSLALHGVSWRSL